MGIKKLWVSIDIFRQCFIGMYVRGALVVAEAIAYEDGF